MSNSVPFLDTARRQVAVSLTKEAINRVDAQRLLEGIPSRSAMLAELIDLGLAIRENPAAVAAAIVDALEQSLANDPETGAADSSLVPLRDASPSCMA